jgi:hypothetical protein
MNKLPTLNILSPTTMSKDCVRSRLCRSLLLHQNVFEAYFSIHVSKIFSSFANVSSFVFSISAWFKMEKEQGGRATVVLHYSSTSSPALFFFDFFEVGAAPSFFWCTTRRVQHSSLSHSNPARIGRSSSSSACEHLSANLSDISQGGAAAKWVKVG